MFHIASRRTRRSFLGAAAAGLGGAAFTARGAFAEELMRTPRMTEGPFYPDKLPLDTDNDLIIVNDNLTPAVGEITHLTGKVLGPSGEPLRNVSDRDLAGRRQGRLYPHRRLRRQAAFPRTSRATCKFSTGSTGEYYFRTIKADPLRRMPGRRTSTSR